jgi:hypothetical protein
MRPVEGTCTNSSSTPMSFAIWRATATSEPSGWLSLSRMPKGGLPTSMATRIFFSLRILSSVLSARVGSATSIAGMATSIATVTHLRPIFRASSPVDLFCYNSLI